MIATNFDAVRAASRHALTAAARRSQGLALRVFCTALALSCAGRVDAQSQIRELELAPLSTGGYQVTTATLRGDETIDYLIKSASEQVLSVDLLAGNSSTYFNVLPAASDAALFIGSTEGNVADVPLPVSGDYRIRVYLVRSAARRGESSSFSLGVGLAAPEYADGLSGGPDYWAVAIRDGGALNLRSGPSTRYDVIAPLRRGDTLQNRGCRMTGNERWCKVRSTNSGLTGWAAGRYLVEGPAPRSPQPMAGGPAGNGQPFDATGYLPCATSPAEEEQRPFGVIREGRGNAGVWFVAADRVERHVLFEAGTPVAVSPGNEFSHEWYDGMTLLRIGKLNCRIPDAIVYGG